MSSKESLLHELRVVLHQAWHDIRAGSGGRQLDPLPIRRYFKGYGSRTCAADLRAGGSVAMLDIPQGMAYAAIAGLPLQYGITCSAVAAIVGALLASSRHTIFGPTNATAFMVFSYFAVYSQLNEITLMPMLVFLVGLLLIGGAVFRVADLAQYISRTVVVAYVTGASILITINQLPNLTGLTIAGPRRGRAGLFASLGTFFEHISTVQWQSLLVAALTLALFIVLRRWRPGWPVYALTLLGSTLMAEGLRPLGILTPTFADASFTWTELLPPFPEFTTTAAFADLGQMFGLAMALAFLATLETSAMSKSIASRSGQRIDQNQNMLGLGVANLACSYLSGMPASCSLTRSALNFEAGARTPFSAIFNGLFCVAGALTIGPLVAHIPKAGLAVLVICVASSLLNRRNIRICLFATRSDGIVFLLTVAATLLLPLHVAIFTGVGVSVILYLRKASRPLLVEYEFNLEGQLAEAQKGARKDPSISIVHVEGELFFGAAELFRTQIQRTCTDPNLRIIILRLKNARHLDATSVMALEELIRVLRKDGRDLIISGATKDVYRVLRNSGLVDVIGKENFFLGVPSNPNLSTRSALIRAQEILGTQRAEVHIYFDPGKQRAETPVAS